MAKVLGESGRYSSQEETKKFRKIYSTIIFTMLFVGGIAGFNLYFSLQDLTHPSIFGLCFELVLICAFILIARIGFRKLEQIEKQRMKMRKGTTGESIVAQILSELPDEFAVINGLTTPFGDLDHIVVGATGVFILDTKNWRGVVSADGKGELLLNGKPTDKPIIKPFVSRIMSVREKITTLCNFEPYLKPVLVFPSAKVDAKWGTTGSANCIRDDQLWHYIVENEITSKLNKKVIEKLSQTFLALATMDKEFQSSPERA